MLLPIALAAAVFLVTLANVVPRDIIRGGNIALFGTTIVASGSTHPRARARNGAIAAGSLIVSTTRKCTPAIAKLYAAGPKRARQARPPSYQSWLPATGTQGVSISATTRAI